jgi:hypothetical protein
MPRHLLFLLMHGPFISRDQIYTRKKDTEVFKIKSIIKTAIYQIQLVFLLLNVILGIYNISTFAAIINNFTSHLIGLPFLIALSPINKMRKAFVAVGT